MKDPHGAIIYVAALSEDGPEMEVGGLPSLGSVVELAVVSLGRPDS